MPANDEPKAEQATVRRNDIDDQLCLLSLDGGGVRGLSSLMILKQLMEAIDPQQPPRPCDYFHMIGGNSTGGLIAIMLGRMRMTVDECILAYNKLAPKVFTKVHHRISVWTGETQGRFDHIALKTEIKALLKDDPDASLREDEEDSCCKVPRRSNDALSQAKIWEAARATSAATTFFDPITIGGETFVDGATGANNPIKYLWTEAGDIWGGGEGLDEARVKCLVSIGTGLPSLVSFGPDVAGLAKALKAISTDTEATASVFQKHHSKLFAKGHAFRFNVTAGLQSVGLHEVEKWDDIAAATRAYIQEDDTFMKLKKCALMLQEREWTNAVAGDIIEFAKVSIEGLNDPGNHMGREDLQWLTHTTPYDTWRSQNESSSFLHCRLASNSGGCSGGWVAASLVQSLPFGLQSHRLPGTGDKPGPSRSLYFQCLAEPPDGVGINKDERGMGQPTVSAHHVLVSLICQAFLVDHDHFEDLRQRLLMLNSADRRWMRLATNNPESMTLNIGVALLATAIST
ncbi:acyl transferase/acyl hydrolase/lysophospholipase, partial [Chaetomium tenue]